MRGKIFGALILALILIVPFVDVHASLQDGLVAYYPFNGNANDESGSGNHGTVHGPILNTDRFGAAGNAYDFDGLDDYIEIPDSDSMHFR